MSPGSWVAPAGSVVVSVTGAESVRARFADVASRTRSAARQLVEDLANQLAAEARSRVPKGKTGRAARSIGALESKPNNRTGRLAQTSYDPNDTVRFIVRARMGRAKDYAYNLEMGQLNRSRKVRGYSRRNRRADVRGWDVNKHGRRRRKIVAQGVSYVEGYQARQTMKPRPYLGPAFEHMRGHIESTLAKGMAAIIARTAGGSDSAGTGRGGPA